MQALAGMMAALLPAALGFLFESAVPRVEADQVLIVIAGLTLAALGAGVFDLTKAVALLRLEGRLEIALQPATLGGSLRTACFESRFRHYGSSLVSTAIHAHALASVFA
jgi:hypothetical protein